MFIGSIRRSFFFVPASESTYPLDDIGVTNSTKEDFIGDCVYNCEFSVGCEYKDNSRSALKNLGCLQ